MQKNVFTVRIIATKTLEEELRVGIRSLHHVRLFLSHSTAMLLRDALLLQTKYSSLLILKEKMQNCINEVASLLQDNRLQLTAGKPKVMWCTSNRKHQLHLDSIQISGVIITPSLFLSVPRYCSRLIHAFLRTCKANHFLMLCDA